MTSFENQEARGQNGLFSIYSLKLIWSNTIDLIFPPRCQHCGRVDTIFCQTCHNELITLPFDEIHSNILPMSDVVSSGLHTGILQSGIQALKYGGQRQLGAVFADRLYTLVKRQNWLFDTIIPVPLHTAGLQKRGYNQAKEISIHLSLLSKSHHRDDLLIRQSQTQSQVGLNHQERIDNVKEAFQVTSKELEGAIVLLVDDVRTTGATMASCSEILLDSGVSKVYGITVSAADYFYQ